MSTLNVGRMFSPDQCDHIRCSGIWTVPSQCHHMVEELIKPIQSACPLALGKFSPLLFVYTKRYKTLASGSYQYCRVSGKNGLTPMIPWPQDLKHGKQGTSYSASCSAVPSKKDSLSCRSSQSTSCILQSAFVSAIATGFTSHCNILYV